MSHGNLREEKDCLNCGHFVEEKFCPHCGQENIQTRQPFHYLFSHFIEDFTHYDGQFWGTIKKLLFKPGQLTTTYLEGKRQKFVPPVKLYIFISFITFFLPNLLPSSNDKDAGQIDQTSLAKEQSNQIIKPIEELQKAGTLSENTVQTVKKELNIEKDSLAKETESRTTSRNKGISIDVANLEELDSITRLPENRKILFLKPALKKYVELKNKGLSNTEILKKTEETIIHTLPKAIFVYLPVFAFFLWLFHDKKKWWYFDHGIFTLHYFSFLLLSTLIFTIINRIYSFLPDYFIFNAVYTLTTIALFIYTSLYFFKAHRKTYGTKKSVSIINGILLFIVNFIGLISMLLILVYISIIMLH
ncbi:DUF3667 domain-containing protein [Chryseobacterium oryctis]|uniref:DUF3667 domain-containing protein n=1 Tax=Chryseobacterium oryctis TaxID=2952618 RepID=A0ABT3HKM0_9FLAO|nr:DUF3667 domain-containing protein [Chryseobacterium oryctis]MCW3160335.1 DUF3667 domain-containing protein [Chryseobacterium oryctis]